MSEREQERDGSAEALDLDQEDGAQVTGGAVPPIDKPTESRK